MDEACFIVPFPADSVESQVSVAEPLESIAAWSLYNPLKLPTPYKIIAYHSQGVAGNPVPYTVRGDSSVILLLLFCFVLFIVSLAYSRHFLIKQLKDFFRQPRSTDDNSEGGGEMRFMVFLSIVNALVLAIGTCLLATDTIAQGILVKADVTIIALLFIAFVAYFCLKWLAGTIVNLVFFGVKKNLQWQSVQLQVTAMEGVLFFPMLVLQIYFDVSVKNTLIYIGVVLFLNKVLTFYKSFQIFFQGNGLYLQTFLYFCALEIVPLLAFGCAGIATNDLIKINF